MKIARAASLASKGSRGIARSGPCLRYASTSASSSSTSAGPSTPKPELNRRVEEDGAGPSRRTTHFGFREVPEEDKETLGQLRPFPRA